MTAGQGYDATAWIRGEVDVDDSRDGAVWIVRVRWEDLNGTYLGYSNAEVGTAAGGLPASFTEKGGTVTAAAGAVYGRVEVYFYLASGWLNVDDITVTPTTTVNISETKYYGFGGDTVGMRVDGVLSWIFDDQLGSTGITYQADGSGTSRQFYYPFGGIRNPGGAPVVDTDVGFTGQPLDESAGLMFYQARYYDPLTARFISADTMIPDPGNPQDFNRYTYVRNNPLGYTDPSGNEPDDTYACPGSLYECTSDGMTFSTGLWSDVGDTAPFQDPFFPEPRKWWNIVISNAVRAAVDFIPVSANAVLSAAYWADDVVRAQRKPVVSDGLVYYDGLPPMQRSYFPTIGMDEPERGLYATAPYVLTQVGLAVWAGKVLGGSRASRLANVSDDAASGLRFRPNTSHIFRDAAGHFAQDTPANRALMINAVRRQNLISERSIGARTLFRYAQDLPDGRQVWAEVLDNVITNGGINGVGR